MKKGRGRSRMRRLRSRIVKERKSRKESKRK
jgi:hypothetical protein